MRYFQLVLTLLLVALWTDGCNSFSTSSPALQGESITIQPLSDSPQVQSDQNQLTPPPSPQVLTLWLTPELDPNNDSASSSILKERLIKFSERFPGTQIQVRIKAASGPGGLMDMLSSSSAAATLAMPSVIALSYQDMETAALKGLIQPINTLTTAMSDNDWYPYAHQLALIQNNSFGLPFGGDTLLLVYRADKIGITPATWQNVFSLGQPILFSAADPDALLTLNLYLSAGGTVANDQGQPELLPDVLTKALNIYGSGTQQGVFPFSLAQYEDDNQTWQAYTEQRANWLITHSSNYLTYLPPDSKAIPIPSLGTQPLSLATGWVWAISDPVPERRETSMRLAEFLSEPDFLAQWTPGLGLLPVRPSGLKGWSDPSTNQMIDQLSLSARVIPTSDIMTSLGPALQQATLQVIKLQNNPLQAARLAAESLTIPSVK